MLKFIIAYNVVIFSGGAIAYLGILLEKFLCRKYHTGELAENVIIIFSFVVWANVVLFTIYHLFGEP